MLVKMPGASSHVADSKAAQVLVQTRLMGAAPGSGHMAPDSIAMTPQLMLLPLPLGPAAAEFAETADPVHPLTLWMRARGTPIGYMPVPMPAAIHQALMAFPPDPAQ
jgi:hypothetical protein